MPNREKVAERTMCSAVDRGMIDWVEKNIIVEYVNEALEKYDKINSGIPIGGMAETVAFIDTVETVNAEAEEENML